MVTNVKMQVTPDLSRRVQEIVFAHGGAWEGIGKKVDYTNNSYLYIGGNCDDISIYFGNGAEYFENSDEEEISAYDFIASNGEQNWLPKFEEVALFSADAKEWKKDKFRYYEPNDDFSFRTRYAWYKYCKPLPKKLVFKDFLEENGISFDKFLENCKVENQRWDCINKYHNSIDELKEYSPRDWLTEAFDYRYNLLRLKPNNIYDISTKWRKKVKEAHANNIKIIWSEDEN